MSGMAACLAESAARRRDRKSTRLNSSHLVISYAVFCLKKKNFKPSEDSLGVEKRRFHHALQDDLLRVLFPDLQSPDALAALADFVSHCSGPAYFGSHS